MPPSSALPPRFASVVAHELRNPLSAVKIALQTVGRASALEPKDITRLGIALREVGTIERVLALVLEWARPSPLAPTEIDARELVERAAALAREPLSEQHTALDILSTPLALQVDPEACALALSELIRNAALSSPANAPVRVSVHPDEPGHALFSVQDSGPGLSENERLLAFEPFWSGRARGVGLGLTVARDIARRHGGELTLVPNPGGGLRALLRLPIRSPR